MYEGYAKLSEYTRGIYNDYIKKFLQYPAPLHPVSTFMGVITGFSKGV